MAGSESYNSLYFTSLLHLLNDEGSSPAPQSQVTRLPNSTKSNGKKYAVSSPSHEVRSGSTPLLIDPVSLNRKKQWVLRNSLAQNSRIQMSYEKKAAAFEREKKKAIHQLQNSKSFYDKSLKQIQDRQMEICKNREKERILIQAQSRYDKVPILETKRFCGACSRRPQSAMASPRVPANKSLNAHLPCACRSVSTSGNHKQLPKTSVRRKTKSAGSVPSSTAPGPGYYDRLLQLETVYATDDSRHLPSPVGHMTSTSPRSISPMRTFDPCIIPDSSAAKNRLPPATRTRFIHQMK